MSIAELIMQGTKRSSESTAWVGDSLAKLGQQVGASLAQREQQKQAQAILPFLQQNMQESMQLAGEGKSGEAYAKLIPFITDPSVINNPNLMPAVGAALKLNQFAADDFLKKEQLRVREGMYGARSDYQNSLLALKQQQTAEKASGSAFSQRFNQARGRGNSPIVEAPLPGEPDFNQPTDIQPTGVPAIQANAPSGTSSNVVTYEPSEQTIQQFSENSNKYDSAKPKQKKAIEAQRTIVYDNQDALGKDISNLDNDQFGFTQVVAGAADPTLFGVKFARFKQGDVNAKGEPTYKANDDAAASIGKLQEAFNLVNDRSELKDIYTKAGGWKNIELKPTAAKKATVDELDNTPTMFEVINKKNQNEKVEVTQDEFVLLGSINKMIPTSQTNDMEIIRVGEEKGTAAEAPAPTQGGLPATQPQAAAAMPEIPEEAMALQKLVEQGQAAKAGETAKNVEARIKDIDTQIKRLSSSTIAGSEGTMSPGRVSIGRVTRNKTPDEAQTDIEKIQQLKNRKRVLEGKYSSPQEVGEAFQSKLLTRAQADAILKNQFKMQ